MVSGLASVETGPCCLASWAVQEDAPVPRCAIDWAPKVATIHIRGATANSKGDISRMRDRRTPACWRPEEQGPDAARIIAMLPYYEGP